MKKSIKALILTLTIGTLLIEQHSLASEITAIFTSKVPVSSQSKKEREEALKLALEKVLYKLTGRKGALSTGIMSQAFAHPNRFVQQYSYQAVQGSSPFQLSAKFNDKIIKEKLNTLAIPYWGAKRESFLLWLVLEKDDTQVNVVDTGHKNAASIIHNAREQGISVILPSRRDVESIGEVSRPSIGKLMNAAENKNAQAIILGKVSSFSGRWQSSWQTQGELGSYRVEADGDNLIETLIEGMQHLNGALAPRQATFFQPAAIMSTAKLVSISKLRTAQGYFQLKNLLRRDKSIKDFWVKSVDNETISIIINSAKSESSLSAFLSSQPELRVIRNNGALHYEWRAL